MRAGTAVMGTLLLATGIAALVVGTNGGALAARPPLDPALARYAAGHGWFWPVAGGVAGAVAVAGLIRLAVLIRSAVRERRPVLDEQTLHLAGIAAGELLKDTRLIPGVREAHIRLAGTRSRPRLRIGITCAGDAAPAAVLRALADGPVERYRTEMDMDDLVVVIRFQVAEPEPAALVPVPEPA